MSAIAAEKPALSNALAMGSAVVFAALGAFLALKGVDPVMNLHGALLAAASLLALAYIFTHSADDRSGYLDGPIRVATLAAVFWGVSVSPPATSSPGSWLSRRLTSTCPGPPSGVCRPLHTSAVIFAFGGNVLLATSFYVVQRTSRARMAGRWAPGS